MRKYVLAFMLTVLLTPALDAQQPADAARPTQEVSLREQLMPTAVALAVTAPVIAEKTAPDKEVIQPVLANRGQGIALMIAGGALFVAGILIDDNDAGTVLMVAGAGIGAYGLYLHFR